MKVYVLECGVPNTNFSDIINNKGATFEQPNGWKYRFTISEYEVI